MLLPHGVVVRTEACHDDGKGLIRCIVDAEILPLLKRSSESLRVLPCPSCANHILARHS